MGRHSATRAKREAWIRTQLQGWPPPDLSRLARLAQAEGIYSQSDLAGVRLSLKAQIARIDPTYAAGQDWGRRFVRSLD